jgi:hypothetical protein
MRTAVFLIGEDAQQGIAQPEGDSVHSVMKKIILPV